MGTRFARGGVRAACAIGILAWLAAAGATFTVRAQELAGEWPMQDESAANSWDEFDRSGGWDCADCNSCDCGDAGCDGSHMQDFDCCGGGSLDGRNWWFNADYLLWRISGSQLPPLLTDSPVGTEPVLGLSTTSVISGDGTVGNDWRSGFQLQLGAWLDECRGVAISGEYFQLGDDDYDFFYPGNSGRNTGRPFFNAQTGLEDQREITGPIPAPMTDPSYDGTVSINLDDKFQGAGLTLERSIYAVGDVSGFGPSTQIILLGGYRFYDYQSRLAIDDSRTVVSGQSGVGDVDAKHDRFLTDNEFHGGEIGVKARITQTGCWFDGTAKVALGGQHSSATIAGETVTTNGMGTTTSDGGLLTSSETNIGYHEDWRARLIPQFRFGLGVFVTPNWTAKAGYSVIVWDGVARPAGQLPPNLTVDPRNIPPMVAGGGASPVFPGLGRSELVIHGLDLGVEYRY